MNDRFSEESTAPVLRPLLPFLLLLFFWQRLRCAGL